MRQLVDILCYVWLAFVVLLAFALAIFEVVICLAALCYLLSNCWPVGLFFGGLGLTILAVGHLDRWR